MDRAPAKILLSFEILSCRPELLLTSTTGSYPEELIFCSRSHIDHEGAPAERLRARFSLALILQSALSNQHSAKAGCGLADC